MARRNWIILALLIVLGALLQGLSFALGVLLGGLLILYSFYRLRHRLTILVHEPTRGMARKTTLTSLFRLIALAALIAGILATGKVHPIGLAVGLSVVVINLLWTTGSRIVQRKE